jgi:hypothetical protein
VGARGDLARALATLAGAHSSLTHVLVFEVTAEVCVTATIRGINFEMELIGDRGVQYFGSSMTRAGEDGVVFVLSLRPAFTQPTSSMPRSASPFMASAIS